MPGTTHSTSTKRSPIDLRASSDVDEILIVGGRSAEALELCAAATAAGLRIRPIGFESPVAEAAMTAFGPGSVRLPLVIVGGRYALERPDFADVLECVDLQRGADRALPPRCAVLVGLPRSNTPRFVDRQEAGAR